MTIEIQKALREAGFATFPLRGKVATVLEWQKLTPDTCPPPIDGNYGVVIPSGILVIDCDPRNYRKNEDGTLDDPLVRLATDIGGLPDTLTVFSGGWITDKEGRRVGGIHKYFRIPAMSVGKTNRVYPGLDFLGKGCYTVGPGSIHPDTRNPYVLTGVNEIAEAPDGLISKLITRGEEPTAFAPDVFTNSGHDIAWFTEYLKGAAPPAIQGENGDETCYKVAAQGRDRGLLPETAYELMLTHYNPRCTPVWSDDELRVKVDNAYKYGKYAGGHKSYRNYTEMTADQIRLIKDDFKDTGRVLNINHATNQVLPTFNNVSTFLTMAANRPGWNNELFMLVRQNSITKEPELFNTPPWGSTMVTYAGKPFDDDQVAELRYYLCQKYGGDWPRIAIVEAVKYASKQYPYNPITQYLNGLKWDGVKRLDNWLHEHCGAEDTEFNSLVGEAIFLGAVARAYKPGCKWDYVPVFESEQGGLKSGFVELLAIEPRYYNSLSLNTRDEKRMYENIKGKWIVEISELAGHNSSDSNAIKKFFSDKSSNFRAAYGHFASEHVKQCIMIGTFNPTAIGYLNDVSGNRRYLPVSIKSFPPIEKSIKLIDALYAEAVHAYNFESRYRTFPYRLMEELGTMETESRLNVDAWAPIVADWVSKQPPSASFTIPEVAQGALSIEPAQLSNKFYGRLSRCITSLKLPHKQVSINGLQVKRYFASTDGFMGEDGLAFKRALPNFHASEMRLADFIEKLMGLTPTPKRAQQVGMWLKTEGFTTVRRYNSERVKETWVIHKHGGTGF